MNLETLYKRSKTGAIQYYTIKVERGIKDSDPATIVKESGQLGTDKPLIHREVISEGKNIGRANETTTLGQARSQAKSDWTKKKDGGYKNLSDLGVIRPDSATFNLEEALESALPTFNTDASGNVMPMLAKEAKKDLSNIDLPCWGQPKLDGVRCLLNIKVGDVSTVTLQSRTGKIYNAIPHIHDVVIKAIDLGHITESCIMDGEIYSHHIEFEEITEAIRGNENTDKLIFMCYDTVNDKNQGQRLNDVHIFVSKVNHSVIERVPTIRITSPEDAITAHDQYVEQGYEGLMLRNMKSLYGQGQRSSDLLKFKVFKTDEFEFDRFVLGQRGIMDMKAMCKTAEGKEFGAKMKGSLKHKTMLYNAGHKAGEQMTVKYSNMTKYDIPRFPVGLAFRDYE